MIRNKLRVVTNLGYVIYWSPEHHRSDADGAYAGYVYEHVLVAESVIGRNLRTSEEVHHLDFNRANNSPSNLLVLSSAQHTKLHNWLRRIGYHPKPKLFSYSDNRHLSKVLSCCPRCKHCGFPTDTSEFCSVLCLRAYSKIYAVNAGGFKKPSKEKLIRLLSKKSWVAVGKKYGVSDNAVRRWAVSYSIDPKDFSRGRRT